MQECKNAEHGYIHHYDALNRQGDPICNSATSLIMTEKLQCHFCQSYNVKRQNA